MENTSDMYLDTPKDHSVSAPAVASEGTGAEEPSAPEDRRITRGMRAAGGVIPPVAALVTREPRARKKPTTTGAEGPIDEEDKSPQGPSQGGGNSKKTKETSPDASNPWRRTKNGVPDMDKLVRLLTRNYTKSPDDSDLAEAAHKYKWRGIGPGKRTLWELRSITLTEKAEARKRVKENPKNELARVKLRLCEAISSHVVNEWEAERHAKWSADLTRMKLN